MPSAFKAFCPQKLNQNFSLCSTEQKASLSVLQRSELSANYPRSLAVAKDRVHRMRTVQRSNHNAYCVLHRFTTSKAMVLRLDAIVL